MARTADEIEVEATSLPRRDRERIAEALIATLHMAPEVERAWSEEIRRRVRDIDSGATQMIPGDGVLQEVEDLLR